MVRPRLPNRDARRLFLHVHELAEPPAGPGRGDDLRDLVRRLGFVQLDTINTVARAHDLILFARRPAYRPEALRRLHDRDRALFEGFTHDASVIPVEFFPRWRLRHARDARRLPERWARWQGESFRAEVGRVLDHIRENGPVSTSDLREAEAEAEGPREMWQWHPSKTAMEFLWRTGRLSVLRRDSFRKIYDLTERVIPDPHLSADHPEEATIAWACNAALDRLGFATSGEIAAFWAKVTPDEAKAWCAAALARGEIIEIEVEQADGALRRAYARPDVLEATAAAPEPTGRLRVLSPFDPALRDRNRTERLFGFHYRIEIFVPEAKRRYGYYVFPLLEGDRIIGRIDMKADRSRDVLQVAALWPEPGVRWGKARQARLEAELGRLTRLAGVSRVAFADGWRRAPL